MRAVSTRTLEGADDMSTEQILAAYDRATDVGTAPTTCPVAWFCPACGEPAYVGQPGRHVQPLRT